MAQPEFNKAANDKAYVGALAVNRRFKNEAGQREADFINLIIWGKTAENFASYAKKESLLSIEAEIRIRKFVDQKNQTRYV